MPFIKTRQFRASGSSILEQTLIFSDEDELYDALHAPV
jgi:hypothetical protein